MAHPLRRCCNCQFLDTRDLRTVCRARPISIEGWPRVDRPETDWCGEFSLKGSMRHKSLKGSMRHKSLKGSMRHKFDSDPAYPDLCELCCRESDVPIHKEPFDV